MLMQAMALPLQGSQVLPSLASQSQLRQRQIVDLESLLQKISAASCPSLPRSDMKLKLLQLQ